jgi:SHS2 domain-containing protein
MEARRYRYLPHTADVEFAAYGNTMASALSNSCEALLNVMLDLKKIKKGSDASGMIRIKESASSPEDLVWFVLQDVLTKIDDKKLLAYALNVKTLKKSNAGRLSVECELIYKKRKEDLFLLEVKAVTPHGLSVTKSKKGYEVRVVVDV